MNKECLKRAIVCAMTLLTLGFLVTSWRAREASADSSNTSELSSGSAGPQGGQEEKPAEQVFKNIQALKGLPSAQLFSVMKFMSVSLGVRCDYCHVRTGNEW